MREWVLREQSEYGLLELLLKARNINAGKSESFLRPDYEQDTHNPFLFRDMEKATERFKKAIDGNERVILFGDYDADGTGGAVILSDFLRQIGFLNFEVYIPDRHKEGYGLKMQHVRDFTADGAGLIITIDCGVTNFKEIEYAQANGVDVIILDHHIIPPAWPPAHAVLNPKREDEQYPYKYICGTALAFKLVDAMMKKYKWNVVEGWQKWLLDVVAISTVADMVPLTGENRVLLRYGLAVLRKTRRKGLLELFKKAGIDPRRITAEDIGYLIAPRINAASRMAHATISYELLTTDDQTQAERFAAHLEEINLERKQKVRDILNEAQRMIADRSALPELIFIGDASWPAGVLGIVANRLMEEFHKPCFVWGSGGDYYKGSCRAPFGVNVVDLMREAGKEFLLDFGGHVSAGGFTLKAEHLFRFKENLASFLRQTASQLSFEPLVLDAKLTVSQVTEQTFSIISQLEPFGVENPKPVFLFEQIEPLDVWELGSSGHGHVKLRFKGENGKTVTAVGFSLGDILIKKIKPGVKMDVAASFGENYWNGKRELRLRIEDVRWSDERMPIAVDTSFRYQNAK